MAIEVHVSWCLLLLPSNLVRGLLEHFLRATGLLNLIGWYVWSYNTPIPPKIVHSSASASSSLLFTFLSRSFTRWDLSSLANNYALYSIASFVLQDAVLFHISRFCSGRSGQSSSQSPGSHCSYISQRCSSPRLYLCIQWELWYCRAECQHFRSGEKTGSGYPDF